MSADGHDESAGGTRSFDDASAASHSACSLAATLIRRHKDILLNTWLAGALERIPAAHNKGRSELADHFVEVLDDVVAALESQSRGGTSSDHHSLRSASRVSAMHGRERAVLEGYTVGQLTQEYVELRRVLTGFCRQQGIDDAEALEMINRVIETAALVAVDAFSRSLDDIQQKLTATLVHDVRTPLGVAYSFAELLSMTSVPTERRREISRTITRSLKRTLGMLEGLLDVAKQRAGQGLRMQFSWADLNAEVDAICQEARQIYHQPIACELEDRPVEGVFDVGLVIRTLENLISNAAKFGREDAPVTLFLKDCGNRVDISVHNHGTPIPESERDRIFCFFSEPAVHGHQRSKGWGLGLSLIKVVADNHGGRVIFKSEESQGTTFGMQLFKHHRQEGDEVTVLL